MGAMMVRISQGPMVVFQMAVMGGCYMWTARSVASVTVAASSRAATESQVKTKNIQMDFLKIIYPKCEWKYEQP